MILLLDTHILLWSLVRPEKLDAAVREEIENSGNTILFSVVSIWEVGIKAALDRPDFRVDPEDILRQAREIGFQERSITSDLAIAASRLPMHHRDPFDRILIAQALSEPARFITADKALAPYSELIWLA